MKIAMWSGPRNLSTALMYSFAQRVDTAVTDEPFYGPYLRMTGLDHPMRDAILDSRTDSAETVQEQLRAPPQQGKTHAYHKHMCQHMIPGMPRDFMEDCTNVFLLRHPARVVASFAKGYPDTGAVDLGFDLQARLFEHAKSLGQTPIVIDSSDIRATPEPALRALCKAIGIEWDPAMLSWPAGRHPADGVWADHWYKSVHQSTGFAGPEGPMPTLPDNLQRLVEQVLPSYLEMSDQRLKIT